VVASDGSVYVADSCMNSRVQKFTSEGLFVSHIASSGDGDGGLNGAHAIAMASDGSIYIADREHNQIQKFTPGGVFVTRWGTYGTGDGEFDMPHGVAVAPDGSVYVADSGNHRIQEFTSDGVFVSKWGEYGAFHEATAVKFYWPTGLTVASDGRVYVSDRDNDRIQIFTSEGVFVNKWGTKGTGDGEFDTPYTVAVTSDGSVYVSEMGNDRIQKFSVGQ